MPYQRENEGQITKAAMMKWDKPGFITVPQGEVKKYVRAAARSMCLFQCR